MSFVPNITNHRPKSLSFDFGLTNIHTARLGIAALSILSASSLLPACSFKKNPGEKPDPQVVVAQTPSGDNISMNEMKVEFEPVQDQMGDYLVHVSWPKPKKVAIELNLSYKESRKDQEASGDPNDQVTTFDAELESQFTFNCRTGQTHYLVARIFPKTSFPKTHFKKTINCPVDTTVSSVVNSKKAIEELAKVNGRLLLKPGARILVEGYSLNLNLQELIVDGVAHIDVLRTQRIDDGQSRRLPLNLDHGLLRQDEQDGDFEYTSHSENIFSFAKRHKLVLDADGERLAQTAMRSLRTPSESALNWLQSQDLSNPQLNLKAKTARGELIIHLAGANGIRGKNGEEKASKSVAYLNLLRMNPPKQGQGGIDGNSHQSCRRGPDGQECKSVCSKQPTPGGKGARGVVPGINGDNGGDGMPSAAAKLDIAESSGLKLTVLTTPGAGGPAGIGGKGQPGGPGGPAGSPGTGCSAASIGPQGDSGAPGLDGTAGVSRGCGVIQIKSELISRTHFAGTANPGSACISRNDAIKKFE
jgi:hypothetical protein